ncbi:hypothetical protein B0J11DRAFT_286673 [Dendryphion nanum]|uniref:Uncharacterized protein n=1 Tax=Dendryphion nanum TaxID=256645 RepID=A0A9P9DW28_9PLEO|nr:hypothetical protein B0J11DRAFT_286673 [Dendryphion nanum]
MDSWTARKRPWEEDSPIEAQIVRQDSLSGFTPPLPQHAGHDTQSLDLRRLPPLYTPSSGASAELPTGDSSISRLSPPAQEASVLDKSRPRSHSLFDIFPHQPRRQRHCSGQERTVAIPGTSDLDRSLPPIGTDSPRPRFGTDPAPHAAVELFCCPSDCEGQACSNARILMRKLASELVLLDKSISQKTYHSPKDSLSPDHLNFENSLQWAFDRLQWINSRIREQADISTTRSPNQSPFRLDSSPTMRRGHPYEREEQSPPTRHSSSAHHGYSTFTHPNVMPEDNRRNIYGTEMPPVTGSPHHSASPSGSSFMPPQSPMHAPQPSRSGMLPSPSSMSFSAIPNLPPISPPASSLHPSAQAAHLQDLQHQISIKTLAFQTLQREYDSLLQKLERQRTKCAALEKKFEVSDVEINSLTDEKEKLQSQVATMEMQVEELHQSRDEARRQLVANGAQYMRIMEMANRLQAQGAEDKRKWETERSDLEQRIRVLEEAMVTGTEHPTAIIGDDSGINPPHPIRLAHNPSLSPNSSSSPTMETINVLRAEIGRLRSRTQNLETALRTMKEESIRIQTAAQQLVESGGKIEEAWSGTMSG